MKLKESTLSDVSIQFYLINSYKFILLLYFDLLTFKHLLCKQIFPESSKSRYCYLNQFSYLKFGCTYFKFIQF